jgi:hypothetical protein
MGYEMASVHDYLESGGNSYFMKWLQFLKINYCLLLCVFCSFYHTLVQESDFVHMFLIGFLFTCFASVEPN